VYNSRARARQSRPVPFHHMPQQPIGPASVAAATARKDPYRMASTNAAGHCVSLGSRTPRPGQRTAGANAGTARLGFYWAGSSKQLPLLLHDLPQRGASLVPYYAFPSPPVRNCWPCRDPRSKRHRTSWVVGFPSASTPVRGESFARHCPELHGNVSAAARRPLACERLSSPVSCSPDPDDRLQSFRACSR